MPTLIAISSAALSKPPISSLAVLGEISIGGTLIKVEDLATTLQVCLNSGAKKVLLPITLAADLGTVPSDLVGAFSLIFYSSPEDAVFKALGVDMINIDNQQMIRENLSNKKILKAIIADLYEDKKVKNLMSLAVDLGIEEEIAKKVSLTKQESYRMAQIFHYEYGTNIEDAIIVVYQWADILGVGYENDDLFFTAKELISANIDFVDWNQLKDM